jgi:hypothetical protein
VEDVLRVEISQSTHHFLPEIAGDAFSKRPVLAHPLEEVAPLDEGHHDDVGSAFRLVLPPEGHVIGSLRDGHKAPPIQSFQHCDFVPEGPQVRLALAVDLECVECLVSLCEVDAVW